MVQDAAIYTTLFITSDSRIKQKH